MRDDENGAPSWRTSRRCDAGACVEFSEFGERILLRDSENPQGGWLDLSREAWIAFLAELKDGKIMHESS